MSEKFQVLVLGGEFNKTKRLFLLLSFSRRLKTRIGIKKIEVNVKKKRFFLKFFAGIFAYLSFRKIKLVVCDSLNHDIHIIKEEEESLYNDFNLMFTASLTTISDKMKMKKKKIIQNF